MIGVNIMNDINYEKLKSYSKLELIQFLSSIKKELEETKEENKALNMLLEVSSEHADNIQDELVDDKKNLELLIEMSAQHADTVQDTLMEDNENLEMMVEMTAEHSDSVQDSLIDDKENLEMMMEMTAEHADMIEAELEEKKQQIRDTFGRYVSSEIVSAILDNDDGLQLGGERKEITILTSDIRGFTRISENYAPESIVKILNYYLAKMEIIISKYMGIIDEFLGDGILVLFGAPVSKKNDALNAVACSIEMQLAMNEINQQMRLWNFPELEMGIGIHTGDVIVGNIGSESRTKYGIVGANVNLTYRIESYSTGGQVLISEATFNKIEADIEIFDSFKVMPKGVKKNITIYNIKAIKSKPNLCLSTQSINLVRLTNAESIRYSVLHGKHVNISALAGKITFRSHSHAFIEIDVQQSLPQALSNIKLINSVRQDIYAKVVELSYSEIKAHGFYIRFTSI
jgi:adenylate cyclase